MASDVTRYVGDVDYQSQAESSSDTSDSRPTGHQSKTNIRVSLACVQCRSKHMKCDAVQPACGRCLQDGKPCYYARSRRGIRDVKKRSLIPDNPPLPPPQHVNDPDKYAPMVSSFDSLSQPHGWTSLRSMDMDPNEPLLSAFFIQFYPGHPLLPPKRCFLKYADSDPNAYQFLLSVIDFCGALYTGHSRLNDLREIAYSTACGHLPFTVQSVQGLYLLAAIAFGEMNFTHQLGFAKRSWTMAIELGMHRKSFADDTSDPVLAESYRRTWWHIKFQSIIQRINKEDIHVVTDYYDVESDVDIPYSEEWEYQSGDIPLPMSQSQFEREVTLGRSDFPSTAFQVEICHIQQDMSLLCTRAGGNNELKVEMINQTDAKLCDFIRRVPRWKMDVVDPEGRPDQVLFGAVAWAHINRIRLRTSTLRGGLSIREYFPLGPTRGPDHKSQVVRRFGWNPYTIDIQAANSFCDLFRYPFPIQSLPPTIIPGISRVAIVYLDACVFLGQDSAVFRERINTLIQILAIHGEIWPLSKSIATEIRAVADEYLPPSSPSGPQPNQSDVNGWNAMGTEPSFPQPSVAGFEGGSFHDSHFGSVLRHYRKSLSTVVPACAYLTDSLAPATLGP